MHVPQKAVSRAPHVFAASTLDRDDQTPSDDLVILAAALPAAFGAKSLIPTADPLVDASPQPSGLLCVNGLRKCPTSGLRKCPTFSG